MRQKDTKDGCTIFTSLAIITSQPLQFWINNQARFLMETTATEWPTPNRSEVEVYGNMFDMVTNEAGLEREKMVRHSVIVVLLLRALRATSYYQAEWRPLIGPDLPSYCALIGWDHDVATPALLCHKDKDIAQGTQSESPLLVFMA